MTNLIQEVDWANVTFSESAIATNIWDPMFHWYWELLNIALVFFPVVFFVSMFWFIYWSWKSFLQNSSINSRKDLANK